MSICKNCQNEFAVYPEDTKFYEKMGVPSPTLCPDCRQQRRLSFRNVGNLYSRRCDLSGKTIISNYSPNKPFKIYDPKVWWTDQWNPLDCAMNYDFSRSFFEQYAELQLKVPRPALLDKNSVNSDYTNHGGYNKNCYMCFNVGESENLYYSTNFILSSKDCVDCYDMQKCELLYECFACRNCYNSNFLSHCHDCLDSYFLYDCRGCSNCFMSWNLRNQEYCILNIKYSPEEYQNKVKQLLPATYEEWQAKRGEFLKAIVQQAIYKYARIEKSNNCSGDQIISCQKVNNCYYAFQCVDSEYCYDIGEYKDSYDVYESWKGELNYETHAIHQGYKNLFSSVCYDDSDIYYCEFCHNSKDLLGCIGLNKKQFCILNKQYSEEEYKKLLPKIIEHMKEMGEWGEFFPMDRSPFAYNETVAQEYYPLTKEEVLVKGLKWKEEEKVASDPNSPQCVSCGRNFKIIPQEKEFYQRMNLPEPKKCFKCRYADRLSLRDPRQLFDRQCDKCQQAVRSIYAPGRVEKIYCEECYRKEIY